MSDLSPRALSAQTRAAKRWYVYLILCRSGNVQLLAEVFRDEPGRGKYQVGARYIIVRDRLEAYASYGNRFNGPSDHWSAIIGIRLQTSAFCRDACFSSLRL